MFKLRNLTDGIRGFFALILLSVFSGGLRKKDDDGYSNR